MKKYGFTLAEVLITLGIIGVISALTIPTFTANTQNAKIGPKLSKAVSVFEQATRAVLDDAQSDSLNSSQVKCSNSATTLSQLTSNSACFFYNLGHHIKGSYNSTSNTFTGTDGTSYTISSFTTSASGLYAHEVQIAAPVIIDINGATTNPNSAARDQFYFYLMDDGSLRPYGGSQEATTLRWQTLCPKNATPAAANRPYCTGHVLENNLKVEYKQ